jgi:hypothetical protein
LNDLKYAKKVLAWMKEHGWSEGNEKNAPHYVAVIIDKCISDGRVPYYDAFNSAVIWRCIILQNDAYRTLNKEHAEKECVDRSGSYPWIFPDSSRRYITKEEVLSLSKEQRWIAKNEIYARNGYIFESEKGKVYAKSLGSLYIPRSRNIKFNRFEEHNIMLISRYE